jgi:hypothetical protein
VVEHHTDCGGSRQTSSTVCQGGADSPSNDAPLQGKFESAAK